VTDRSRVLGAEHPHVLHSRLQRCQALIAAGRTGEAAGELTGVLQDAERILEPGHRHVITARTLVDGLNRG
jgi:hypothetical protein